MIVEYETLKDTQLPAISVSVTPQQDGDPPETGKHPNLWQRIQDLFNFEPEPPTPALQQSQVVIDALFTELVENDKRLGNTDEGNEEVATPDEESETVTASMAEEDKIPTSAPEEVEPVEEIKAPAFPVPGLERKDTSATPIEKTALGRKKQPSLVVYCLGTFRVYQNDQLITEWQSLKSQAIFKYLLSNSEMPVPKNILMDLFWPDATPKAARRNLHQAIYSLRQLFRGEQKDFQHIRFENDRYFLNPEIDIWLDFKEFEQHVKTGRSLEAAGHLVKAIGQYGIVEGLYQGDFLEEDLYEDWIRSQRRHFHNMYMDITDRLSRYYIQQGELITAIALCRKLLDKDNCHEGAHRRLMHCYLAQGQRHLALRQYQTCVEALRKELDIEPATTTFALYEQLRRRKSNKP